MTETLGIFWGLGLYGFRVCWWVLGFWGKDFWFRGPTGCRGIAVYRGVGPFFCRGSTRLLCHAPRQSHQVGRAEEGPQL